MNDKQTMKAPEILSITFRLACGLLLLISIPALGQDPEFEIVRLGLGLEEYEVFSLSTHGDFLYAAADTGGIYRLDLSKGPGGVWQYLGMRGLACREVAVRPDNSNVILAGVITRASDQGAVYMSIDGGDSWVRSDGGIDRQQIVPARPTPSTSQIRFNPENPDQVLITIITFTPHQSTDGGATWRPFEAFEAEHINDVVWVGNDPGVMYAAGEGLGLTALLLKSTDWGETWEQKLDVDLTEIGGESAVDVISISPFDPNLIVVGTEGYFLRSTNSGENWEVVDFGRSPYYMTSVDWDSENPDLIFSTGGNLWPRQLGGVYVSSDNGISWGLIDADRWCTIEHAVTVPHYAGGMVFAAACQPERGYPDSLDGGVFLVRSKPSLVDQDPSTLPLGRLFLTYGAGEGFRIREVGGFGSLEYSVDLIDLRGGTVRTGDVLATGEVFQGEKDLPAGTYLYFIRGAKSGTILGSGKVTVW